MSDKRRVELFTEIMASDKLTSGYQYFGQDLWAAQLQENPSVVWQQLRYNPWLAMAVYADMEDKDSAVGAALYTRKTNVLSKTRNVLPCRDDNPQDKKIAEFVEECLNQYFHDFEAFLFGALDAIGKGVAVGEIIFAERPDRVYIEEVKFKPQHLFSFGDTALAALSTSTMAYPQTGPLQLRSGVLISGIEGQMLPEDKFFVFSFNPRYGNRWGDPVDRKAFWPSWIKRSSVRQWLKYQEKGTGTVMATFPGSSSPQEQKKAMQAAAAAHEESAIAKSDKVEIEVLEMTRSLNSSHKELVDNMDADIFRIYLGQTLTSRGSEGGGSRAMGEVHERKEDKIGEADCKALMAVVNNQIIPALVHPNFGPDAECPKFVIEYEAKENLDGKAKRYAVSRRDIGIDLSIKQIREDLELEEPVDAADTLKGATEASVQPGDGQDPLQMRMSTFAEGEKKKIIPPSETRSISKTARFQRQRPSMIEFSDE